MINLKEYLKLLDNHNLTHSQYVYLYIICTKDMSVLELYVKMYGNVGGYLLTPTLKQDLIDRNYIVQLDDNASIHSYKLSEQGIEIFVTADDAVNEVYNTYPSFFVDKSGVTYPLSLMDKTTFKQLYWNKINGSREEHNRIIDDIKYGKEYGLINCKMETFFNSDYHLAIRKERLGEVLEDLNDIILV